MKTEILTVMRDPSDESFYIASYSGDKLNEAHNLAFEASLNDAITEALKVYGLSEDDVYIEASN